MTSKEMRKFSVELQGCLSSSDRQWSFNIPSIPSETKLDQAKLVKYAVLTSNGTQQHMKLSLEPATTNRAISNIPLHFLLVVSFAKFHIWHLNKDDPSRSERGTAKETKEYVVRLLSSGIVLNGTTYNFYGHSNSQLKSRTCFMYAGSKADISKMVEGLGDFSSMKTVGKKVKRIGLLFSTAEAACLLQPDRYEDIDDVEIGGYTFTDGCGLIAFNFAKRLVKQLRIAFRNRRYLPSVYQIRYRGYKGVLELDKRLTGNIDVKFRSSMKKFKGGDDLSFAVVEYSKPYSFGYLNDEVILLLHSLGVSEEVLISKQAEHLKLLSDVHGLDGRSIFRFLSYVGEQTLAEQVLLQGPEALAPRIRKLVAREYDSMLNKRQEQRCRIFVLNSRLLYGVCDPIDCLRDGECFVRITMEGDGQSRTLMNTQVLVTRNPCLHPGDLQKFRVVDKPELSHLVDCIVFPTRGRRPSADLMSGGDLDGDKFFVCWDQMLVPNSIAQAAEYPAPRERQRAGSHISDQDRLEHFANAANSSLGRVKNLYLDWARLRGPLSSECQELNRLFSQCVDGNLIRVPAHLETLPAATQNKPPFILDILHNASIETIRSQRLAAKDLSYSSFEAIHDLLSDSRIASSEFELVQLTFRWCCVNGVPLSQFSDYFDFNLFSVEEKAWVSTQIPSEIHLVQNSLNQSNLLQPQDLIPFRLGDHRIRWKRVFDSSEDRMARFFEVNSRVCELFHKKLLVLRVDERLTIAIYIPCKIEKGHEEKIDDRARVFSFPRPNETGSTFRRALKTKKNYKLFCDDGVLQLYENQRASTWIFLQHSPFDDTQYRNLKSGGDRRRTKQATVDADINYELRASVDLGRFSQQLRTQIGRVNRTGVVGAEIYVISNKDLASLRTLDLWLDYVDTDMIHPLFSRESQPYEILSASDRDWSNVPSYLLATVRSQDFTGLRKAPVADLGVLFQSLLDHQEKVRLYKIYEYMLHNMNDGIEASPNELIDTMIDYLQPAPFLMLALSKSKIWTKLPEAAELKLAELAHQILESLVLQINEIGSLVAPAFEAVASRWRFATAQAFGELIELASLTISDQDLAMDLLLTCLEPLSIRIMTDRPSIIRRFVLCLLGLALNHIEEANEAEPRDFGLLKLTDKGASGASFICEARVRIDLPPLASLRTGDHVRLKPANAPANSPMLKLVTIDALVSSAEPGRAIFNCFQRPPSFVESCSWNIRHCGSFVTSKAMFDATISLYSRKHEVCQLYDLLSGAPNVETSLEPHLLPISIDDKSYSALNPSQMAAVQAGLTSDLTCLWGPPGTGKTHTVCTLLAQILTITPERRLLVTAPTNNAVDNLLRMFVKAYAALSKTLDPLRVSTDVSRVSSDLKVYAVDGMMDVTDSSRFKSRKIVEKRIQKCKLVFTTCIGAGLGLLRRENFDTVFIDEASQVTEPESYVPLVKGCNKAILVGDHVQLRPIVGQNSVVVGFDTSLFERLYSNECSAGLRASRVMLDTQYRMPESICEFSSEQFYEGKLQTSPTAGMDPIPKSTFPWPSLAGGSQVTRRVLVQCSDVEDIGHRSKGNAGQAKLTQEIYRRLTTPPPEGTATAASQAPKPSIAILTPYTRQREAIKGLIPGAEVSSIDGFQGKEADIVVFVTVRCNAQGDLGFLRDMRRLNVALTRARVGLIVVGDRATLAHESEDESAVVWQRLMDWLPAVMLDP